MEFRKAVRHLEDLGMVVVMPDGKAFRTKKAPRRRNPVRVVPVRVIDKNAPAAELAEMIRQSRAEINHSAKQR
jgi:hypothetical protein